ncbi:restriction endonuclease subunit S [Corynebacterium sp. AOP34-AQ2-28]|uniref:restriction endonuclease subunit S n=1 Tax=Corynebacterium sp. AOP34-AQ2-28 TaxID=3457689 RepID=UPI004033D030
MTWLESMPSRWEIRSPKALFEERRTANLPDDVHLTPSQKYGVLPQSEYMELTGGSVVLNLTGQNAMKHVEKNDFIIHLRSFQGGLERVRKSGKVSTAYTVVKPKKVIDPDFFKWLLKSSAFIQELQTTTNQLRDGQSIRWTDFVKVPLPVPPRGEQPAIADYLDRETQKIDELIAEQRSLIESLRERRQALITSAVIAEIKKDRISTNSSWYPSIPKGWSLGRVKYYASRVTDGAHISPVTDGGIYDFVSTRDIKTGKIDFSGSLKTTSDTYKYMVKTGCRPNLGDVLFSKDGTVGEVAVVRADRDFVVASSLVIISPDQARLDADYLAYVFASKTAREQAASMMRGAGLPRLSVANLARTELPLPSRIEQRRIVDYLDEQTSRIDELIGESDDLIALSQERRVALITAAVTGQIDVREAA